MKINNQISADIQFIGNCIKKIQVSNDIINLTNEESREFGIDISVNNIAREKDNLLMGLVDLGITVNIRNKKTKKKSKFDIVIEGCFKATDPQLTEEKFGVMLYINGGSTLYSIARSFICSLSANTYQSGKILLPMVNIVEVLKQKINAQQQAANDDKSKPKSDNGSSDKPNN